MYLSTNIYSGLRFVYWDCFYPLVRGISAVIFLLFCWTATSQVFVDVNKIGQEHGLKERIVYHVIRDKNGYFIIVQTNAIQRFDGRVFEDVKVDVMREQRVLPEEVDRLDLLRDGTVLFTIKNSEKYFVLRPGSLEVAPGRHQGKPLLLSGRLFFLIGQSNGGYRLTEVNDAREEAPLHVRFTLDEEITTGFITTDGFILQTQSGRIYHITSDSCRDTELKGVLMERKDGICAFTRSGIYLWSSGHWKSLGIRPPVKEVPAIVKKDKGGNIILSYSLESRIQNYVFLLDTLNAWHNLSRLVKVSNTFTDVYTDDGWFRYFLVGYNGIQVVTLLRPGALFVWRDSTTQLQEFGNVISCIEKDSTGTLLFASEAKGFFEFDDNPPYFYLSPYHPKGGNSFYNATRLLYDDSTDSYYALCFGGESKSILYRFNRTSDLAEQIEIPYRMNDMILFGGDKILLGGHDKSSRKGALILCHFKTKKMERIKRLSAPVRSLYVDKQSHYWVGSFKGLYVLDSTFEEIALLNRYRGKSRMMLYDHISMVYPYRNRLLCGSRGGGIYVVHPLTYTVEKIIDTRQGLSDNMVAAMMNDDQGHCWVTTFNGISVLDTNLTVIKSIYDWEGLPNREFNTKAIKKDQNGYIYAGTLNGLLRFDPQMMLTWEKTHKIDIRRITVYDKGQAEEVSISVPIRLYNTTDSVVIQFNTTDYYKNPGIEEDIYVKLVGNKNGLRISRDDKHIKLSNLPEEDFSIMVYPDKNSGETRLDFEVHHNYTAYYLFFGSLLLLIAAVYWSVSLMLKRRLNAQRRRLEQKRKISELQLKSLQAQMNPHFMNNALGAIQYYIHKKDTDKADEYLANFALLILYILDSSKSRFIKLSEEIRILKLYIGLEQIRYDKRIIMRLKYDAVKNLDILIPPMLVQPFVENAIYHGLRHLHGKTGKLNIYFEQPEEQYIVITIEDNGIGREAAKTFRRKGHISRGLNNIDQRIEAFNTLGGVDVRYSISDLFEGEEYSGTRVVIYIRMKASAYN